MKKKNLILSMLAMAGMLFATSCSQDELLNEPSNEDFVNATFSIGTTDGIGTRATIGNGTKANKVACAVYDESGTVLKELSKTVDVTDKKATYEVRLAKGQKYRVAFFAYNSTADAYDVTDLKNIKIKDQQNSNIEDRDAFTNYIDVEATVNAINKDVTLYRPFAQLNLGVDDTEWKDAVNAGVEVAKSKIVVTNVYNQFSAYDNTIVADAAPVTMTFAMNTIPTEKLEVDVNRDGTIGDDEKFKYLALNYLLVGDAGTEKSLTDVEFVWENGDASKTNNPTTHFLNIPVQRNYRTNIIGKLLTNPATFNIIIDAEFIDSPEDDYIVNVWDGESVEEPKKNSAGAYEVKTAAEWVWLANKAGTPGQNENNYDIVLSNSIDFGGKEVGAITFNGTFDGQGNSVRNAILTTNDDDSGEGAGLFGNGTFGTIKNLDVYNVSANINSASDGWVGAIVSGVQDQLNLTLENVHVYNSNLKGVMSVGGLAGNVFGNATLNLTNCSVNDSKVWNNLAVDKTENGHVAGLVGRVSGTLNINENVVLNNVDVVGYYSEKRKEGSIDAVAATNLKDNLGKINGNAAANNVAVSKIPTTSAAGNATIASAEGMFAFAKSLNEGGNNYSGKTVTLTSDIDLEKADWEPIGQTGGYSSATYFLGTFNGNNKTIRNLKVTHWESGNDSGANYASGLFGFLDAGAATDVVKDLTINGVEVEGHHWAGAIAGYLTGKVSNCKVINATIKCTHLNSEACGDKAGVIVGYVNGTQGSISACHAENSTVTAGRDAGQIVGASKSSQVTDCTATNVVVSETGDCNDDSAGKNIANSIIGRVL